MIIVDTGVLAALLDQQDGSHHQAKAAFGRVNEPLISTYPVITEVCFLLNHSSKCKFLQSVSNGLFEVGTSKNCLSWVLS